MENRILKDELQKIHTLVKKTGLLSDTVAKSSSSKIHETSHAGPSPQQKAKAGVCLLILLFSFGLFFNIEKGSARIFLERTGSNIPRIIESVPSMVGGPVLSITGAGNVAGNRRLLETNLKDSKQNLHPDPILSPPQPLSTDRIETNPIQKTVHGHYPVHKISIVDRNVDEKKRGGAAIGNPSSSYEEIALHKSTESQSQFMAEFAEMMNESINSNVSELQDVEMQKWFTERLKVRPNTAFFSVSDFQQIIPPNMQPFDSNSPFFVSLLVPARSLANQLPATANHAVENSVIEVTCQIIGVNQTSLDLTKVSEIRQVPIMA